MPFLLQTRSGLTGKVMEVVTSSVGGSSGGREENTPLLGQAQENDRYYIIQKFLHWVLKNWERVKWSKFFLQVGNIFNVECIAWGLSASNYITIDSLKIPNWLTLTYWEFIYEEKNEEFKFKDISFFVIAAR